MHKPNIILIGNGGHSRSCIEVIEQNNNFNIAGLIGKSKNEVDTEQLGYKVIATDEDLGRLAKEFEFALVVVGQIKSPSIRIQLFKQLIDLGFKLPTIIAPTASVSTYASIGKGTIIMQHAIVNAGAEIGMNCILNSKSLIEHDCIIKDHCHISTGAILNGGAKVDDGCFIGSGCIIKQDVSIGKDNVIEMGSVVYQDSNRNSMNSNQ